MKQTELDGLHIEISVLSPFERVSDPLQIEVGRDGLYIKRGSYCRKSAFAFKAETN